MDFVKLEEILERAETGKAELIRVKKIESGTIYNCNCEGYCAIECKYDRGCGVDCVGHDGAR